MILLILILSICISAFMAKKIKKYIPPKISKQQDSELIVVTLPVVNGDK